MLHICNIYKLDAVTCVEHYYSMSTEVYGVLLYAKMGEYVSTQTLVIHHWVGPSVIAHLAPDSTPDRAE